MPGDDDREVETVTNFTPEECNDIVTRISPKLHGKLRSLFSVISDDMLPRGSGRKNSGGAGNKNKTSTGNSSKSSSPTGGGSGASKSDRNPKRGATSPAEGGPNKHSK